MRPLRFAPKWSRRGVQVNALDLAGRACPHGTGRRLRRATPGRIAIGGLATALAIATAQWGGGVALAARSGSAAGSVLTVGELAPAITLNPALQAGDALYDFILPAYDPLILRGPTGTLEPDLATSWGYVGKGNETFELTLRKGVRFSDGSALTASGVAASLTYDESTKSGESEFLDGMTFTPTGKYSLRITSATPDPMIALALTQSYQGFVISPEALKDPSKLGTTTDGAGEYVLNASQTVIGSRYTYTPNPYYWNKSQIHYQKIVLRVVANASSEIDALKTGQIDYFEDANPDLSRSALAADHLKAVSIPQIWDGLNLIDRSGKLTSALANLKVRQALNYAVDRKVLSSALEHGYGTPTDETARPGGDGWVSTQYYSYDPAKARQLLSEAGYPHGFSMPVVDFAPEQATLTEAMCGELASVGVQCVITNASTAAEYLDDGFTAGKSSVVGVGWGLDTIFEQGPELLLPTAEFNPYHTTSSTLDKLWDEAAGVTGASEAKLDQEVESYVVEQAWFIPVTTASLFYYYRPTITGVTGTPGNPLPDLVWLHAAKS
jgi:peptide/nickel transport system substrate-binding protein